MLTGPILFISLIFYTATVSQPLFYLIALGNASRNMRAPAYVEMRHRIDEQMRRNGAVVYYGTLFSTLLLVAVAFFEKNSMLPFAILAFAGLIADISFMKRGNIPINAIINTWTPEQYPVDWERHRDQWLRYFSYRQIALFAGFLSLLAGVVFPL